MPFIPPAHNAEEVIILGRGKHHGKRWQQARRRKRPAPAWRGAPLRSSADQTPRTTAYQSLLFCNALELRRRTPHAYFFPGVIAVKLPIGLTFLTLLGVYLFVGRRLPKEWNTSTAILLAASLWFLFVLGSGSTYAGIRHALPVVSLLAIMGGIVSDVALTSKAITLKGVVALALLAAAVSALPVMRPWEYYNEAVGGAANAYRYFDDEGVDLSERTKEMARYYREVLQPTGEIPYIDYFATYVTMRGRGLNCVGPS